MKAILFFLGKPFRYTVCFSIILLLFTFYTFLDAFYIKKEYAVMSESPIDFSELFAAGTLTSRNSKESDTLPAQEDKRSTKVARGLQLAQYTDENIDLTIEQFSGKGGPFFVADVKLSSVNYLRTALHNGQLGKNITAPTSEIAQANNALFAVSGDYAGFNELGIIQRNGQILRVVPRLGNQYGLVVDIFGDFQLIPEIDLTEEKLKEIKAVQCFSLGPTLVVNGEINISESPVSELRNPRCAIGQVGPLHYIFIVTNGRNNDLLSGFLFDEMAEEFYKRGCITAYNLDGGGTATMWYDGTVLNNPSTSGESSEERNISDIIFIPKRL